MDQCPPLDQLQRLLDEQLEEADRSVLDPHVQTCDRCQAILEEWTRSQGDGPVLLPTSGPSAGSHLRSVPPVSTVSLRRYSFLAPPRARGELGWLAQYRVVRLLGEGGMGVVFQAEDTDLQRPVALKVLQPEFAHDPAARQRFLREARAMAAVRNEHVITIFQVGQEHELPFLAMELLEGELLEQRLTRLGKLPIAEVLRIGRETALGLAAAHAKGLVHRDIKPANLWLETTGEPPFTFRGVKVLDFGLVLAVQDNVRLTRSRCVVGTPSYMAPEQARGETVDPRSDLFSLGCVLYHLVTGEQPFRGDTILAVMSALALEQPRPLHEFNPACPAVLEALVLKLLAKNPEDRPASAQEVARALQGIEQSLVEDTSLPAQASLGSATVIQRLPRELPVLTNVAPRPSGSRRGWLAAAGVMGVLGLLSVVAWLGIRDKDGSGPQPADGSGNPAATVPAAAAPGQRRPDQAKPFVLVRGQREQCMAFETLAEALAARNGSETVEVHGHGPFRVGPVQVFDRDLTLRAAAGYRPRFVWDEAGGVPANKYWFTVERAALHIEGSDFRMTDPNLGWLCGGGARWVLRDCRAVSAASPEQFGPGLIAYTSGPELRCSDCFFLQWRTGVGLFREVASGARLDLANNVLACLAGSTLLALSGDGGQTLQLTNNTLVAFAYPTRLHGCSLFAGYRLARPATVEATGNLICFPGGTWDGLPVLRHLLIEDRLRWRGHDNFYAGLTADPILLKTPERGLAAWQKLAGGVEQPREAEHVAFAWQLLQLPTAAAIVEALQGVLAQHRNRASAVCGPDWQMLGPGEAYVRALAAEGQRPVKLRPPPHPRGPFVLLRNHQMVDGHPTLAAAAAAATDGDTIEVRSDGPFPRAEIPGKQRNLTLCAGAGYRPVLEQGLSWGPDTVTVEGLEVRGGGIQIQRPLGRIVRLANCLVQGPVELGSDQGASRRKQVVNCLLTEPIHAQLQANQGLSVRHTVLPRVWVDIARGPEMAHVSLERCVCWNASSQPVIGVMEKSSLKVVAEYTLLASVGGLAADPQALAGWSGRGNVYLLGQRNWYGSSKPPLVIGLEEWRLAWKSDVNSIAAEPPFDDPRQWRLLPNSPGYRQAPGGKDYGADVSQWTQSER